ncbi:hypothetical protein XM53_04155 [Roseovarius atlanticus]|uniref:Thiamine biosynthesis protein ApbE n=1 Tax=Roseovarius atlanticus TaxID=1641875 RepID=A0A0T5NXX6_9RHOB|nr:UPF0280 family protein [Roseovarius atlanticus]KRS13771.1 hypothetical protein XM53_04155 [Roseovarius atlanticus]
MRGAQANWLSDGRRLHLHHGPIDMIVGIEGAGQDAAFQRAAARFGTLLEELVAELPRLRSHYAGAVEGETARRMVEAVRPFTPEFITPMAAVAGAGAETILRAVLDGPGIRKAYVNNGGDVAFHIGAGEVMRAALASPVPGHVTLQHGDPVRGVATSGAGGRSHSLGIADAVTVLASGAAMSDAAATMIANAVDLPGHPAIDRVPACELSPDSDLGPRAVTRTVGALTAGEVAEALDAGRVYADRLVARGMVHAACLSLRGQCVSVGESFMIEERDPEHA